MNGQKPDNSGWNGDGLAVRIHPKIKNVRVVTLGEVETDIRSDVCEAICRHGGYPRVVEVSLAMLRQGEQNFRTAVNANYDISYVVGRALDRGYTDLTAFTYDDHREYFGLDHVENDDDVHDRLLGLTREFLREFDLWNLLPGLSYSELDGQPLEGQSDFEFDYAECANQCIILVSPEAYELLIRSQSEVFIPMAPRIYEFVQTDVGAAYAMLATSDGRLHDCSELIDATRFFHGVEFAQL